MNVSFLKNILLGVIWPSYFIEPKNKHIAYQEIVVSILIYKPTYLQKKEV